MILIRTFVPGHSDVSIVKFVLYTTGSLGEEDRLFFRYNRHFWLVIPL